MEFEMEIVLEQILEMLDTLEFFNADNPLFGCGRQRFATLLLTRSGPYRHKSA